MTECRRTDLAVHGKAGRSTLPLEPAPVDWQLLPGFGQRLRGLLGRPPPAPAQAWCLPRCRAVHTLGMRYPIDVVFIGRDGRITRVCAALPPGRWRGCLAAVAVAELRAGEAARLGWRLGVRPDWPKGLLE